jgi:hypothetical protein
MPAGLNEAGLFGVVTFPAIKFAGYSLAGYFLKHRYQADVSSIRFGMARAALGVFAGMGYAFVIGSLEGSPAHFYLGLIPVRIAEWMLLIWMFYESEKLERRLLRLIGYSMLGVVWSYILDLYVILPAAMIPDWLWIC